MPRPMKLGRGDSDAGEFRVTDLDPRFIGRCIRCGPNRQAGLCRGVPDHFVTGQWASSPVLGDEAEQAMFDLVPLTRTRWKVTDAKRQSKFIG